MEGILSFFLSFHHPLFRGTEMPAKPFPTGETKMTIWLRRIIIFLIHRLELFLKGHFWVTIRKFVVTRLNKMSLKSLFGDET